ncbi:YcxB family protein [Lachnobacterium bovis]|uniref:YcxB family protein n=1 Tax=Lachnobacterium bovis TaxID=140626 RepID=UPI000486B8E4|nr:YcxB family protein [Lachnobacterium bovis]
MKVEFKTRLQSKNLFRFNMYQIYTSSQGIISIIAAIFVIVVGFYNLQKVPLQKTILTFAIGLLFLFYLPITLYRRAKVSIKQNEILAGEINYTLSKEGVKVKCNEEEAVLPWKSVYKVVETKTNILIYSTRVNAYVIPREQVKDIYDDIFAVVNENLEKYRISMKPHKA